MKIVTSGDRDSSPTKLKMYKAKSYRVSISASEVGSGQFIDNAIAVWPTIQAACLLEKRVSYNANKQVHCCENCQHVQLGVAEAKGSSLHHNANAN